MLNVCASISDNSDSSHILGYIFGKHRNPSCKVKIPHRLCPRLLTDELRASLAVPVLAPGAPRTDLRLDLDGMVVLLARAADDSPIPLVPLTLAPFLIRILPRSRSLTPTPTPHCTLARTLTPSWTTDIACTSAL